MLTKEVTKGMEVRLKNGNRAIVLDGLKHQATRLCKVFGDYTEMGSVYSTDIVMANVDGLWTQVSLTPKQVELVKMRSAMGF
jgi:hypothetical protein